VTKRPPPTAERLRELFDLDAPTLKFFWKVQRGRARSGDRAGSAHHTGRRYIGLDRGYFREDRLLEIARAPTLPPCNSSRSPVLLS
jgi:hypothetical protein